MADVLFFILGSLFSLALVLTVLALMPAQPVAEQRVAYAADPAPRPAPRQGARPADPATPRLSSPPRLSAAEREMYRISAALDQAERALGRIARSGEAQAAKIAAQTLRRLQAASEPPSARLAFARSRLELLSLRPEPNARAMAASALGAMV